MTKKGYKQSPEHIAARKRFGAEHGNWSGGKVSEKGGRARALHLYPVIGPCVSCGSPRSERHHRDENTANNHPANIVILCRRCHMKEDGRLAALKTGNRAKGERNSHAVLTVADIRKIRELRAKGTTPAALSERFGVRTATIWRIVTLKSWRHV
jgi:5-methylcytosine-specific restriction endonuclease McrA